MSSSSPRSHGMTHSPEYRAYHEMKKRCTKSSFKDFHLYGGRGVVVCARWMAKPGGFQAFFNDVGRKPSPNHTLDRFPNPDGNYEPTNCRWATTKEQARNRRVTLRDETGETLSDIADRTGLNYWTILSRFKNGDRGDILIRHPLPMGARSWGG